MLNLSTNNKSIFKTTDVSLTFILKFILLIDNSSIYNNISDLINAA